MAKAIQVAYRAERVTLPAYREADKLWIEYAFYKHCCSNSSPWDILSATNVGPFQIIESLGKKALKLDLPDPLNIHPVIHVVFKIP